MRLNRLTLAIAVAGGMPVSVYADQAINTILENITVSASPIHEHEAFEVPSQIDAVDEETKRALQSGSLGEMLSQTPGVNNLSAGPQSGKPVIRGMTGERVKVLSNGSSTDYQAYGTRHLPNVDPYLAGRIEVIRGPQSVLYGSEALGGVVNVLSDPLPFEQEQHGEVDFELNSNNDEMHVGTKVGAGSRDFAISAGASIRKADDFKVPNADTAVSPTPASPADDRPLFVGTVPYTNFENRAANIGLGWRQGWGQITLRHQLWQSKQNYLGIEADGPNSAFEALPTGQKLSNQETQLSAEIFSGDWILKPSWVYTLNKREAAHDLPYETMAQDEGEDHYLNLEVKRHDLKMAAEHPSFGDFEGEIGVEFSEKEQRLLSGHLTPSADVSKQAVYLFEEADYDRWLVQIGARYDWHHVYAPVDGNNEHFTEEAGIFDESNNERDFAVWSGSLGATYRLDDSWSLAGNIARGFRAPSIFELYAGGEHGGVQAYQIGNPELEEETALNTDLSLRWDNGATRMVATAYQNWVDNYIYLANTGLCRGSEGSPNEGEIVACDSGGALPEMQAQQTDAVIRGFEFNIDHRWNKQWQSSLALEWIQGRDEDNSRDLPLIPAHNMLVQNSYLPADWNGFTRQKWTVETKLVADKDSAGAYEPFSQFDNMSIGRASTDAYALWNLRYSAMIKGSQNQKLYMNLAVENLFDKSYVDFLDTYKGYTLAQGRNFKLNLRVDF
ncbi:TonB-dependent receptor [Thiomicrorhabdus sp. 6S3-12]|uniref:TonB-dependent receptor n=1 Tax=Thiomicrorhabdus sp. 6S3-12 TaxID=2819681 RepID=UPI001AAC9EA7|nr:TonB-dependent receptor [Thiomicrorhabdus sp. 6S3-12]MBO1923309.1 TonB-dependent receptor [Thiomicrorhabdus sp. 6S3-12]